MIVAAIGASSTSAIAPIAPSGDSSSPPTQNSMYAM
jgi:hypothetical protein